MEKTKIRIEAMVAAPPAKVWDFWTSPDHVTKWNAASDDWHSPRATNDLTVGGTFNYRMEARNKSAGFDFRGTYTIVTPRERIHFVMGDGRHVDVRFVPEGDGVRVVEEFETETTNSAELQRTGWQAILDNFKRHVEAA